MCVRVCVRTCVTTFEIVHCTPTEKCPIEKSKLRSKYFVIILYVGVYLKGAKIFPTSKFTTFRVRPGDRVFVKRVVRGL